jgi:hypothetical protein
LARDFSDSYRSINREATIPIGCCACAF